MWQVESCPLLPSTGPPDKAISPWSFFFSATEPTLRPWMLRVSLPSGAEFHSSPPGLNCLHIAAQFGFTNIVAYYITCHIPMVTRAVSTPVTCLTFSFAEH